MEPMKLPENMQKKVDTLLLKTTQNGATQAEQDSALKMINQIYERHGLSLNTKPKMSDTFLGLDEYRKALDLGTVELKITEFDWDKIAQEFFDHDVYGQYIQKTHEAWERRTKTKLGLAEKSKDFFD
jgi:hypothetical protein